MLVSVSSARTLLFRRAGAVRGVLATSWRRARVLKAMSLGRASCTLVLHETIDHHIAAKNGRLRQALPPREPELTPLAGGRAPNLNLLPPGWRELPRRRLPRPLEAGPENLLSIYGDVFPIKSQNLWGF